MTVKCSMDALSIITDLQSLRSSPWSAGRKQLKQPVRFVSGGEDQNHQALPFTSLADLLGGFAGIGESFAGGPEREVRYRSISLVLSDSVHPARLERARSDSEVATALHGEGRLVVSPNMFGSVLSHSPNQRVRASFMRVWDDVPLGHSLRTFSVDGNSTPGTLDRLAECKVDRLIGQIEDLMTTDFVDTLLRFPLSDVSETYPILQLVSERVGELEALLLNPGDHLSESYIREQLAKSKSAVLFVRVVSEIFVSLRNGADASEDLHPIFDLFVQIAQLDASSDFHAVLEESADILTFSHPAPQKILRPAPSLSAIESHAHKVRAIPVNSSYFNGLLRFVREGNFPESFCANTVPILLEKLLLGIGPDGFPAFSVTRVALDLVQNCKHLLPYESKVVVFPQLLQSGLGTVANFHDGDVLFVQPQGDTAGLISRMATFTKLELFNEVFVSFTNSDASGIEGLRREWLSQAIAEMTNPTFGLLEFSDEHEAYVKPVFESLNIPLLRILGRLIGLAIRYEVSPGIPFTSGCILVLANEETTLASLERFVNEEDPGFIRSLRKIDLTQAQELSSELDDHGLEGFRSYQLGRKAVDSVKDGMQAIFTGMSDTIRLPVLRALSFGDLSHAIRGERDLDMDELERNTSYLFGEGTGFPNASWVWEILHSFTPPLRALFLKFVSGSPLKPISGFVHRGPDPRGWLQIYFDPHMSTLALPRAATCIVRMRMPLYPSVAVMREKLVKAITYTSSIEEDVRADFEEVDT